MMVISYNSSRYEIVMDRLFTNLLHILSRSLISVAAMLQFDPVSMPEIRMCYLLVKSLYDIFG